MKKEPSKKLDNSSSVFDKKKSTNLVVQTSHQTSFDSRWAELKIQGKNISGRSNHIAVVFGNNLYIHGGYDVDKGLLADFHMIDISQDCQEFIWKNLKCQCNGNPLKLKNHSAVVNKQKMYIFGGQQHTNESSNMVYTYDFINKTWQSIKPNIQLPKMDSHSAINYKDKMYVYGGYIPSTAQYQPNIYTFNFESNAWEIQFKYSGSSAQPFGRSNLSMVQLNGSIYIFGGTNGVHTLNQFWKYEIQTHKWSRIQSKNTPQARRGHSMITFQNVLFMFGGIQDITKQKNDIFIYQPNKNEWNKIHTSTNSIYDCSPTLKREKKSPTKNSDKIQLHRVSPQKNSQKGSDAMKKILNQNKHKKFLERKKQLLKQFNEKPEDQNKVRSLSPTTQSMLKTLEAIGNQESSKRQLRQQIMYDDTHRYIIGKKPCARDGQSISKFNNKMYIFGGDRHLMAFNDLYSFDLQKGLKSLQLYKNN